MILEQNNEFAADFFITIYKQHFKPKQMGKFNKNYFFVINRYNLNYKADGLSNIPLCS